MPSETDGDLALASRAEQRKIRDAPLADDRAQRFAALAARYGTPLYLYDASVLRQSYRSLAEAVGLLAEIYYSIKANPQPEVARVFVEMGAGVEIASVGEYERALQAGCPPHRILFAGPGKTDDELERVVAGGVGEIHVESMAEIDRLGAVTRRLGQRVAVSLRVNPVAAGQGGAMLMGGRPSPFGIDEEDFLAAADRVAGHASLELKGVHLFAGTQILDAEVLGRQWAHGLDVARRLAAHIGRPLATIDLGGGLGIPYFAGERSLDLPRLAAIAAELRAQLSADALLAQARVIVEPGRFLAGPAGAYLTRVTDVKTSRGTRFVVVDGGMHHHLAASGNLGQVVKRDYPIVAVGHPEDAPRSPATVVGPLCTPLDTLARKAELPDLAPGDLVAVLQSGAYGLSASPTEFLSRQLPVEVLVDGLRHRVLPPPEHAQRRGLAG
jgi:diaminopimelate decarboxylase